MPFWKKKQLTLPDLAKRLKLSPRAVSEALYGSKTGKCSVRVSEKTRKRVQNMAEKLHYRPNRMAQTLSTGKSGMVGVLAYQDLGYHLQEQLYFARIYAQKHGLTPNIHLIPDTSEESLSTAVDFLVDAKVDGAIVFKDLGEAHVTRIHQAGIPVVTVGGAFTLNAPRYLADIKGGAVLLAKHLIQQGVSSIAYLHIVVPTGPSGWAIRSIQEGTKLAVRAAHTKGHPLSFAAHFVDVSYEGVLIKGQPNMHGLHAPGYIGMKNLIASKQIPEALICSGFFAHGALLACAEADIQIPRDMLIGGFGDIPLCSAGTIPLTSIHIPYGELCRLAMEDLHHMAQTGETFEGKCVTLPCTLVPRKSTQR